MKKLTVLCSMLLVVLLAGQGLAWADAAVGVVKKPYKCNFVPGNRKQPDKQVVK